MTLRWDLYWKHEAWDVWRPSIKPLPKTVAHYIPISICTVCMNRTHDLKHTLIKNVQDNEDYEPLEFVVLNYNSDDDLDHFMMSSRVYPLIRSGKIKYLRTSSPDYYSTSHPRNIAFKYASGNLLTNVDADNFTGQGFASYLNLLANVCPEKAFFAKGKSRNHGRVGMYKNEFFDLGGYDEDLVGYGWEDISLMLRAMASGHRLMWWLNTDTDFGARILTPKNDVSKYMSFRDWRESEAMNRMLTIEKLNKGEVVANRDHTWGAISDLEIVK